MTGNNTKEFFLSFFFPRRCRFCDKPVDFRRAECKICAADTGKITGEICMLCGFMKRDCVCAGKKNFYKAVIAPFYYEGAAGKAVRRLKHRADENAVDMFAGEMAAAFSEYFPDTAFDLVTSVPLSEKSKRKRGYNQAELLAEAFAERISLPYVRLLTKTYETKAQHTLIGAQRSGNLLGVFEPAVNTLMIGKKILICDDVKTTGATLNECAKTLLVAGAAEVVGICATLTRNDGQKPKKT